MSEDSLFLTFWLLAKLYIRSFYYLANYFRPFDSRDLFYNVISKFDLTIGHNRELLEDSNALSKYKNFDVFASRKAYNLINIWLIVYLLFQNIYSEVDEAKSGRLTKYLWNYKIFAQQKSRNSCYLIRIETFKFKNISFRQCIK